MKVFRARFIVFHVSRTLFDTESLTKKIKDTVNSGYWDPSFDKECKNGFFDGIQLEIGDYREGVTNVMMQCKDYWGKEYWTRRLEYLSNTFMIYYCNISCY